MGQIIPPDNCGKMPATFMELLAAATRVASDGTVFLNFRLVAPEIACDCDPFLDCDKNHMSPDEVLANLFDVDNCGNVAIKIGNCDGTAGLSEDEGGEPA